MSNTFNSFYIRTLKYELCNKFSYKNITQIPKVKKVVLNFGCKAADLRHLTASLLALELITHQKGVITKTKLPNVLLKIKRGSPSGCKVTLRKARMLNFLIKLVRNGFSKLKNFDGFKVSKKIRKDSFSFELNETLIYSELEKNYYLFNKLKKLGVTIVLDTSLKQELVFFLRSFQFPLIVEK